MEVTKETKVLRKLFGSVKIRQFVVWLMLISLVIVTVGMNLALNVIFSQISTRIEQEGLEFARQEGISREIVDIVIDYANMLIRDLILYITGFVIITTFIINIFIDWVNRRLVIAPLERIGIKAQQISEDRKQLGDQIEPPLFEELKDMTEAFNTMSIALEKQMEELEQQVQERTEELEAAKEKMEHMAKHDALTGLPNRWLFDEQLEQSLRLAERKEEPLTILMIDLDNYKEINDTSGHLVGDEVIKNVGQRFEETLRGSDLVSRWGGDEFAVLLYDVCEREDVEKVVEKIFSAFQQPIQVEGTSFMVKMSVGVACYSMDGEDMVTLLKHADAALYSAKEDRERNSIRFYGESMNGA
ncbi:MAG: diguanylate cyclase domain-containing protein [Brevefilum sp.]